jgi:PTH1 family peptidyl-tRNA hydrolase
MPTRMNYLIAGLGNPGNKYIHTRHNIGFKVVDFLSHHYSIPLSSTRDDALYGFGTIAKKTVLLVKPYAFMNRSGPSVYRLAQKYRILGEKMIVIHDDLDLAFGRLKIKEKGGSGGHKGIDSLIDAMSIKDFIRIRIGIGRPENGQSIVDYVLSVFSSEEIPLLDKIIARVGDATKTILCQGTRAAMNSFNDRRLKTSS